MVEYIEGDIFSSPAQVIVNTVNTVGVMGKGLALAFKKRYPDMFDKYRKACENHQLTVGKLMLFYEPDHWILLFPTKDHWRYPSKLEYIESGLKVFTSIYSEKNISSIAFPRLGCGNGELNWNDVRPIMEKYLKPLPIDIYIYLDRIPSSIPEHKEPKMTIEWLRENAKDMSFDGVRDDLYNLAGFFPYKYTFEGRDYELSYQNQLTITEKSSGSTILIDDDKLFGIWDLIRSRAAFSDTESSEEERAVYGLLCYLGYLSKIRIIDSKSGSMEDGFQVNAGLGRVKELEIVK